MRVATYARYSSDQQRATSIPDQQHACRAFCERNGWTIVAEFADAAMSGATLFRPGIQALKRAALAGDYDVVVAEALDRFSRDQEDTAGLFKRLRFAGVRVVTLSEGEIGPLHVGLQSTVNAIQLVQLGDKTRRGQTGLVQRGRSAGGNSYGYTVVPVPDGETRGQRAINETEAEIVRRIFTAFAAGASHKTIARALNAEGIPPPRGSAWSPSTIFGHAGRGTGILNNELYVGRLVWNRQRFVKDPDTGKRLARKNPPSAWVTTEVPHLRIIDDALWNAVKAIQARARRRPGTGLVRHRRPKYLFSGLTKCGSCGGGFILSSHDNLVCFNARERGTCSNRRSIKRQEVEQRVLTAIRERLFTPGRFAKFCEAFTAELTRLRREQVAGLAGQRQELAAVERKLRGVVQAITEGFRSPAIREELEQLEARKAELLAAVDVKPLPALHPAMAEVFRRKVTALADALYGAECSEEARADLRGVVDRIEIPAEGLLQVVGNLGAMLAAAQGLPIPVDPSAVGIGGCGGSQPSIPTDLYVVAV